MSLLAWYKMNESIIKYNPTLLDYSTWKIDSSIQPGFNGIGAANKVIVDKNPQGKDDIIWESTGVINATGYTGGMQCPTVTIDPTKIYRYSIWMRKKVKKDGRVYFGPGPVSGSSLKNMAGVETTTPYFLNSTTLSEDWLLYVSYVLNHSTTETGTASYLNSGIYDRAGNKVGSIDNNFKFQSGTTGIGLTTMIYGVTDASLNVQFYQPRIECVDGTEVAFSSLYVLPHAELMLLDSSGNENHAALQKSVTTFASIPQIDTTSGKLTRGLVFANTATISNGGYVNTRLKPRINKLTFQYRVTPTLTGVAYNMNIFSMGDNNLLESIRYTDGKHGVFNVTYNNWMMTEFAFESGKEYDVTTTYEMNSSSEIDVTVYVNGEFIQMRRIPHALLDYTNPLCIGQDWDGSGTTDFFNGSMSDFRIYDHILSLEEIKRYSDCCIFNLDTSTPVSCNETNQIATTSAPTPTYPASWSTEYLGNNLIKITALVNSPQIEPDYGNVSPLSNTYTAPANTTVTLSCSIVESTNPYFVVYADGFGALVYDKNRDIYSITITHSTQWDHRINLYIKDKNNAMIKAGDYIIISDPSLTLTSSVVLQGESYIPNMSEYGVIGSSNASLLKALWMPNDTKYSGKYIMGRGGVTTYDLKVYPCTSQFTFISEFEVKNPYEENIILNVGTGTGIYLTYANTGKPAMILNNTSGSEYRVFGLPNKILANTRYTLAFIYNHITRTMAIYLNGENITESFTTTASAPNISFASVQNFGTTSPRTIYDMKLFSSALSLDRILAQSVPVVKIDNTGNIYSNSFENIVNVKDSDYTKIDNLVIHGYLEKADNTNFSAMIYDTSEMVVKKDVTVIDSYILNDNYIEIPDTLDSYEIELEYSVTNSNGSTSEKYHLGIVEYDKDKNLLDKMYRYFRAGTKTTLSQNLVAGDTIVHLTSTDNWNVTNGYVACFGIASIYPDYFYTREILPFTSIDTVNKTVTLTTPYSGVTLVAGTAVQNNYMWKGFNYCISEYTNDPSSKFIKKKVVISGRTNGADDVTKFANGTKYIRLAYVPSVYGLTSTQTIKIRSFRVTNISNPQSSKDTLQTQGLKENGTYSAYQLSSVGIADGLIRWYPLEKDLDDIMNHTTLSLNGTKKLTVNEREECFEFDGSTYLTDTFDYVAEDIYTFSIVLRAKSSIAVPEGYHGMISKCIAGTVPNLSLWLDWTGPATSTLRCGVADNTTTTECTQNQFPLGTKFVTIAMVYEFGLLSLYVDGFLIKSTATNINPKDLACPLDIGRAFGGSSFAFKGWMNNIKIFKRALTPEEVMIEHQWRIGTPVQQGMLGTFINGSLKTL